MTKTIQGFSEALSTKCVNEEKLVRAKNNVISLKAKRFLMEKGIDFTDLDNLIMAKGEVQATDEEILAEYIKLAGLVKGDASTKRPTQEEVEEAKAKKEAELEKEAEKEEKEAVEDVDKPVRKRRK